MIATIETWKAEALGILGEEQQKREKALSLQVVITHDFRKSSSCLLHVKSSKFLLAPSTLLLLYAVLARAVQENGLYQGLSQMMDAVVVGAKAYSLCNPSLTVSALKSLKLTYRIPAREYSGPCQRGFVTAPVNTRPLTDSLARSCARLRMVSISFPYEVCTLLQYLSVFFQPYFEDNDFGSTGVVED